MAALVHGRALHKAPTEMPESMDGTNWEMYEGACVQMDGNQATQMGDRQYLGDIDECKALCDKDLDCTAFSYIGRHEKNYCTMYSDEKV